MSNSELLDHLNSMRVQFLDDLGCEILSVDPTRMDCRMRFDVSARYCHSGDVIQGGFVAAMLDAVSTHALFAANTDIINVSTLELKVSYLEASRMGALFASGRVIKMTRSVAFLEAELQNSAGSVTATMTATAKIRLGQ